MSEITRITRSDRPVRTSGTVLSEVRRPGRGIVGIDKPVPSKGDVKVEKPAPEPKKNTEAKSSPTKPESNDASVKSSRG